MVTAHAICYVMARLLALLIVATTLAGCAGHVADYIPKWAGGPPQTPMNEASVLSASG
jgi:hypothetical protein